MIKSNYKKEIVGSAQKVYETMLGLKDKHSYEFWTKAFNPTSSYEGSWEKGSKIYFIGFDEKGQKKGMVSQIEEHIEAKFVSILHIGFLEGDVEITSGEEVEKWTGGHENYTFEEHNGVTTVTVDIDVIEEYLPYFNEKYPAALELLNQVVQQ